jgi:hypothetical protein
LVIGAVMTRLDSSQTSATCARGTLRAAATAATQSTTVEMAPTKEALNRRFFEKAARLYKIPVTLPQKRALT